MITGIAFLVFLICWAIAPIAWVVRALKKESLAGLIMTIIGALGLELMLVIVLAFMNAITYNGIFNWAFWTN